MVSAMFSRSAMARRYRKTGSASNRHGRRASKGGQPQIVERDEALTGRAVVEAPVSLAEVIDGVGDEIERLSGFRRNAWRVSRGRTITGRDAAIVGPGVSNAARQPVTKLID